LEESLVRWGREDARDRQQVLCIEKVRRWIHDEGSRRVFAEISWWRTISVGHRVLITYRDRLDFLAAIKDSFPHIELVVREYHST